MKTSPWIMALFGLMSSAADSRAQVFFTNTWAVNHFGAARTSSFVRFGPRPAFVTTHYRWYFQGYYSYPSYWGYPYLGSESFNSSPVIVINPPAPSAPPPAQRQEEVPKEKLIIKPRKQEADEKPDRQLPGKEAGNFRPVQPADRDRAGQQLPPEKPAIKEARPLQDHRPPNPPLPIDLVSRGKQAFAAQEYQRAERFFQRATANDPGFPLAHFFLAQARFALHKYREAGDAILSGLRTQGDWPKSKFGLEDLYAGHRRDLQEQLVHLRNLLDRKPPDPTLLNLYAYQLWFAGHPDEATIYFLRAAEIDPNKTWINFFVPPSAQN
jgi:tetratricopeptide (TPR) repeat protein